MQRASKVIVVGGGPAGLMAAGTAAAGGTRVVLLERMDRVGLKLGLTGKGRCNLTNLLPVRQMLPHYGAAARFLRPSLGGFCNRTLIAFFEELGVPTVVERGGRVFPQATNAPGVARALRRWVRGTGVRIVTGARVERILVEKSRVIGAWAGDDFYRGDCVILATGGMSYPRTGSTGDGFRLAAELGHSVVPLRPALVPLQVPAEHWARDLAGLALKNVRVQALAAGRDLGNEFGEMLFTHTGVSGPIVLTLSRVVVDALRAGLPVELSIDLKPALDVRKLDRRLLRELDAAGRRQIGGLLKNLLPRRLVSVCLAAIGIPFDRRADQCTREERRRLLGWLKAVPVEISEPGPAEEAIVTAGGVSLKEVEPKSMASRLVRGLYFAGEILDIDADTGGYNLQAAFSTGRQAGQAAGECLL